MNPVEVITAPPAKVEFLVVITRKLSLFIVVCLLFVTDSFLQGRTSKLLVKGSLFAAGGKALHACQGAFFLLMIYNTFHYATTCQLASQNPWFLFCEALVLVCFSLII